jgi:peptide/nickel transport system permease protein
MVVVIVTATFLCFAALSLSGDPLVTILGPFASGEDDRTQQIIADTKEQYHLDKPLVVRYGYWLADVVQGDFGYSYSKERPVADIITEKLPRSLLLMVMAQVIAVLIAIPWAVFTASKANSGIDRLSTSASFGIIAIPNFALGVILFYLLNLRFGWFPTRYDDSSVFSRLESLFVPALTLGIGLSATYQRLLRTDLITTLQQDFILMARSKGVPKWRVLFGHALRPSMFSFITVFGLNTGALIGGALVIENIFTIPGVGGAIAEAVFLEDIPLVLGLVVIFAVAFVAINFLVDLVYSYLDPRVRSRGG